ncbi:MAG TPA: cytochrome P450 [Solirubrobacterales bacterium]|nr:cytochrome P450 [Solirubrobacterales bacterium]
MLPAEPKSPPLVQTLRWAFRPLPFMQECRERIGDNFSVKFLGFERPMVMISDPAAIKALYTERSHGLPPGREVFLEPVLGSRSLLLLEGADHLAHRKLMLPAFHGERMRSYEPVMEEIVDASIDSWPLGEEFRIHPQMQAITLDIILRVVFGVAEGPRLEKLRRLLADVLEETASPFTQLMALATRRFTGRGPWARFEGALRAVDELLYAEIAERRAEQSFEERDDILSILMAARFEDGEGLADVDLRDQLLTLLLAGHETTATALAWTFDLLLRHPEPLQRLRDSIEAGEDEYMRATIAEALRLRPVVPLAGRRLNAELSVDGLTLPAGTDVTPAIWLTHTRADVYPEPFAFRPERFLGEAPDTYAWVPFGGGVRRCIGAAFSEFEMRIVLREVLTRCELHKADPTPEKIGRRSITLSPKDGTPVVIRSRRPAREHGLVAA